MIRAICAGVSALLLLSACMRSAAVTRVKPFQASPVLKDANGSEPGFHGYRLSASFVAKGPFRDGAPLRVGAIVGGLRVRPDASGLRLAETVSEPPLQTGVGLPDAQGGGLLFWNNRALYTADSFLGSLTPLLDVGFRPARVSFGPSFVLVRGEDGRRLAIDLHTRAQTSITPPLLVDIASTADGSALALLEGGACASSEDGGKSYRAVTLPPGTHALSVQELDGALLATLSSGARLKLKNGHSTLLEPEPAKAPPQAVGDALWPLAVPPLEQALRFGVPLGEQFAGVAVAGGIATVNLRTGELVQMTRALVPSDLSCRALEASGGLLLVCSSRERGSLVLSDVFGEHPQIQATFPAGVEIDFAEGVLVAAARCDGQVRPGAVCVRDEAGRFRDFDVSAQLAKLDIIVVSPNPPRKVLEKPTIVRWVPKEGGGAVAMLGGAISGLLDAQSGSFVPFAQDMPHAVLENPRTKDDWIGLDWLALIGGRVRGWLSSASISIDHSGRIEPNVYDFNSVAGAGAHALAFDHRRHVFQSSDWGRSWVETLAPPGSASGAKVPNYPRCSQVGCVMGPWLRVGWDAEVPAALARSQVAPAPPGVAHEPLPLLTCTQLAAAVVSQTAPGKDAADAPAHVAAFGVSPGTIAAAGEYQAEFAWSTTHPIVGPGNSVGLRAGMLARVPAATTDQDPPPKNWPGFAQTKRFSFVSAFDPSARLHTASVTWRALFDAARASGAESPSLDADADSSSSDTALPILGPNPGQSEGLLLTGGAPVWLHETGAAEAVSFGHSDDVPISAVASAAHTLLVLSASPEGTLEVSEVKAGQARRLFQWPGLGGGFYPGNADALAVGAQGALAVLRTPSAGEPATTADPAWLLHADGSISPVAPWSRLFTADAPECKPAPSDYRAVLQTSRAWLHLVDSGQPVPEESLEDGMFAVLRVNPDRLCLEAVELASAPSERGDDSYDTRLSARFTGSHPTAAKLGFAPGFELRQPLSCSLNASR